MTEQATEHEDSLLILAPEGRDASVLRAILAEAGLDAIVDQDGARLIRSIEDGVGAGAVLTDAALTRVGLGDLREAVERQPAWSDFPFIVLARRGGVSRSDLHHVEQMLNATVLERPLHPTSLVSAARSAIRGRRRSSSRSTATAPSPSTPAK